MDTADAITAAIGLVGALVGAAAGYLGAVRAAARGNRPAWTSAALDAARMLLAAEDPASRAEGSRLLEAAAAAISAAADAPEQIRRATRTPHLVQVLEQAGAAGSTASPEHPPQEPAGPDRTRTAVPGGAAEGPRDAAVVVTTRDVDAAEAEVRAFRAAGLVPERTVVDLADAGRG